MFVCRSSHLVAIFLILFEIIQKALAADEPCSENGPLGASVLLTNLVQTYVRKASCWSNLRLRMPGSLVPLTLIYCQISRGIFQTVAVSVSPRRAADFSPL